MTHGTRMVINVSDQNANLSLASVELYAIDDRGSGGDEFDLLDLLSFKSLLWTFVLPCTCLIGLLTNALNMLVFRNRLRLKNPIYGYMLVHSAAAFVFLAVSFAFLLNKSRLYDRSRLSYHLKFAEVFVYLVVHGTLYLFMILIELAMSLKRLCVVNNYKPAVRLSFRALVAVCMLIAVLAQTPSLQLVDEMTAIVRNGSERGTHVTHAYYNALAEQCARSRLSRLVFATVSVFRGFVAPVFLLSVNLAMIVAFRRQTRAKLPVSSSAQIQDERLIVAEPDTPKSSKTHEARRANENLTRMVILVGLLFLASSVTTSAARFMGLFAHSYPRLFEVLLSTALLVVFSAKSASFLIYYNFDRQFRAILAEFLAGLVASFSRTHKGK